MDKEEMVDIIVVFNVEGATDLKEKNYAIKIALKAHKLCNHTFVKPYTICYNAIWKILFPNYTKEEYLDEQKMYTKLYMATLNNVSKFYLLLCGGYWFMQKRKVSLNYDYYIIPLTDDEINKYPKGTTHKIDDMISIKRFWE